MDEQLVLFLFSDPRGQALLILFSIWSLAWKGFALWKAAGGGQRNWFIAILILNTFGILEIVYLFYFQVREGKVKPKV